MADLLCGSTKAIITKTWHLRNGKGREQKIPPHIAGVYQQHCHMRRY
jgi:hypothetical protein